VGFFAAHGLPLGLQLFTLGEAWSGDPERTLERVARIGYRTVELPGIHSGSAKKIRAAADSSGLSITSVHVPAQQLPRHAGPVSQAMTLANDLPLLVNELRTLGASNVVVPLPPFPAIVPVRGEGLEEALIRGFRANGGEHWKRTAEWLNERAEDLHREGISLSYHNHNFEFSALGDTCGWEILLAHTDPKLVWFELDIAWVAAAGIDPLVLLSRHSGLLLQMHVKDILRTTKPDYRMSIETTEVGSGKLDWKQLLPEAHRAGVRQFYVEQEPPFCMDRFDSAAKSYAFLSTQV